MTEPEDHASADEGEPNSRRFLIAWRYALIICCLDLASDTFLFKTEPFLEVLPHALTMGILTGVVAYVSKPKS